MTRELPLPKLDASHFGTHHLFALTDEGLYRSCGVRIAFTSREGGVSLEPYASLNCAAHVGDNLDHVMRNRQIVMESLFSDGQKPLIIPSQIHGTNIVEVNSAKEICSAQICASEGADGILVRTSGIAALLNFADCLPLILVMPSGDFTIVHAGWRGAFAGIASKAAGMLAEALQDRSQMNAYIGPFIHGECFEVGQDIAARFADRYGKHVLLDSCHIDLFQVVKTDLLESGLVPSRIVDAGICTQCEHDRYFSYRAEGGQCGRHSAVALREECLKG